LVLGEIVVPLDPVKVKTELNVNATLSDPNVLDTFTAKWEWDDKSNTSLNLGAGTTKVNGIHPYTQPGVYSINLTVKDNGGLSAYKAAQSFIVVYDPEAGFVTGGGWINSPAGAYVSSPTMTGKATFGFVSKYPKGKTIPTGNTEFQFHAASMNFQSTNYEWLVVSGAKAQYKGNGTINGAGNYGFMLSAIDGQVSGGGGTDKFRIKISNKTSGILVYDNQLGAVDDAAPTTVIGGGSIVVHK
jgi:PKD repeat protein